MPGFNPVQCVQGTLGAWFLGSRANPEVGAAAAVASFITNPSCGFLQGAGPGTYTQTSMAPSGTVTTWTNHIGNPGDTNNFTTETIQNPDGSSSSKTWNSDGSTSSTYTPPPGPVSYTDDSNAANSAASDGSSDSFGAYSDGGSDGAGGGGNLLMC